MKFITSDFELGPGWTTFFETDKYVLCRKGWRFRLQVRDQEWERQRDEHFVNLHGMTREEAMKPENSHLFVARMIPRPDRLAA